jgi:hypothetical protein
VVDEKVSIAARHGGVMYSPFNDYWLSRIDGFRRVPAQSSLRLQQHHRLKTATPALLEQTISGNV